MSLNVDVGGNKNRITLGGKWKILDIAKSADYKHDLNSGKSFPFKDNFVSTYYCSHTLEHVRPEHTCFVLREMWRTLAKGGKIRIIVPNMRVAIRLYHKELENGIDSEKSFPVGGIKNYPPTAFGRFMAWLSTPDKGIISGHNMGFDWETLRYCLDLVGFRNVERKECNVCSGIFKGKDFKRYAKNSIFAEAEK